MAVAVVGRKIRKNVNRKTELRRPVSTGAVVGELALGLGRTVAAIFQWTLGIAFVIAVSIGILFSYRWVTNHDFFRLEELKIEGGQRLSSEEIAELGGVRDGMNVLEINIAEVQRRIAASEWVESVSVTRVLPHGLIIDIKEREPFFLTRREDRLFYADANGQPIVALGVEKFISLPLLEKEEGVPVGLGIRSLLDEVARNTLPFGMQQIAWVRQDSAEQFSLFLEKPQVLVQLDGTDLPATLACLNKLWADLEGRGELDQIASMFVMPGRAWIRLDSGQTL